MAHDDFESAASHNDRRATGTSPRDAEGLASQVIDLLCERTSQNASGARQFILDFLLRATLRKRDFDGQYVLDELRGHRLTLDSIIDIYIPQVARILGEMWARSDLDFASVTVGSLRLQTLLSLAAADSVPVIRKSKHELSALVVVPAGEQHVLGASVVAAQLRRLGIAVAVSYCEGDQTVVTRVEMDAPDMVLISCARLEGLEVVTRTVRKIRNAVFVAPVLALGGPMRADADRMKQATDVDLVTNTAKDVVGFCAKRVKALSRD